MHSKPYRECRCNDQADRKRKHRTLMVPKRRLVGRLRLFVEQRRNE